MDVFVLERGSKYEGGGVVSLHTTRDAAFAAAEAIMQEDLKYWDEYRADQVAAGEELNEWDKALGVYKYELPDLKPNEEQTFWRWTETADFVSVRRMPVLE